MARLGGPTTQRCRSLPSLERGAGQARLDGHGRVQKDAVVRRDNPEIAPLRQRVNFAGVSGARCEEAQTEAR